MGQVLRRTTTTTEAVRRALQQSDERVRALARRYGIGPTVVPKWRRRISIADRLKGPAEPLSTTLTLEQRQ